MAVSTSTAVKNARLDAISSTWGASPKLRLYAGTPPANAAAALSSNGLLAEVTAAPAAAANGTKDMIGGAKSTTGAAAAGSGTYATFYRVYDSAGTNSHEQGLVAQTWAASTPFAVGVQVGNGGNVYRCTTAGTSASSGGPTGTGASITDGTATWAYVGTGPDITIDNSNIAQNQAVNINTFTKTEP